MSENFAKITKVNDKCCPYCGEDTNTEWVDTENNGDGTDTLIFKCHKCADTYCVTENADEEVLEVTDRHRFDLLKNKA